MMQTMKINGLTCDACTKLTTKRIQKIEDVEEVSVDLTSGIATIYSPRTIGVDEVNEVFEGMRYRAEDNDEENA